MYYINSCVIIETALFCLFIFQPPLAQGLVLKMIPISIFVSFDTNLTHFGTETDNCVILIGHMGKLMDMFSLVLIKSHGHETSKNNVCVFFVNFDLLYKQFNKKRLMCIYALLEIYFHSDLRLPLRKIAI